MSTACHEGTAIIKNLRYKISQVTFLFTVEFVSRMLMGPFRVNPNRAIKRVKDCGALQHQQMWQDIQGMRDYKPAKPPSLMKQLSRLLWQGQHHSFAPYRPPALVDTPAQSRSEAEKSVWFCASDQQTLVRKLWYCRCNKITVSWCMSSLFSTTLGLIY